MRELGLALGLRVLEVQGQELMALEEVLVLEVTKCANSVLSDLVPPSFDG